MTDISDTLDAVTDLLTPIGVIAAGVLLWTVGSRLVRKYVK